MRTNPPKASAGTRTPGLPVWGSLLYRYATPYWQEACLEWSPAIRSSERCSSVSDPSTSYDDVELSDETITIQGYRPVGGSYVEAEVSEDGWLVFRGLKAGTYIIREKVAPNGYNRFTGDIEVTIVCKKGEYTVTDTRIVVNAANDPCEWSGSITAGKVTGSTSDSSDVNGVVEVEVINKTGGLFPSTGGIGTTIFYTTGIAMLVGAGALVIIKKRASER